MKHLAFGAGVATLLVAAIGALYLAIIGEVRLTNYRFWDSMLRGPGAYALALGMVAGGAVAFFASCVPMWPKRRALFENLRTLALVVAGGSMVIAVLGGYMARGGVSAI
jgi:hypothetical protein